MTVFSNNLKHLRTERNLSQQKLADILGISQRKYSYYENGQSEPNLEILTMLSDFFGKSLDILVRVSLPIIADKESRDFIHDFADKSNMSLTKATGEVFAEFPHVISDKVTGKKYKHRGSKLKEYDKIKKEQV